MDTLEELHQRIAENESESMQIPIGEIAAMLLRRWRFLALAAGLGFVLALGCGLMIPNQYKSTAQLMPPDPLTFSNISMLNALNGVGYISPSMGGLMMSTRTPGATAIGILSSRTAEDDIVNRLNLMQVYRCKLHFQARKALLGATTFDEDKKSGLISISVSDVDPNRARETLLQLTLTSSINSSTALAPHRPVANESSWNKGLNPLRMISMPVLAR